MGSFPFCPSTASASLGDGLMPCLGHDTTCCNPSTPFYLSHPCLNFHFSYFFFILQFMYVPDLRFHFLYILKQSYRKGSATSKSHR